MTLHCAHNYAQMLEHTMYLCSRWAARVKSKKSASEIVLSISPIEELPTEILMLIFEEYCDNWSPADKTSLPQLCLSQVNRQWRSIAVSLASLWTKLAITPQFSSYIVSVYLKRSQQLPLDLDLDLRYEATDDFKRDRVLTIWKAVKSSADRWRRLTLQLGPQDASAVSEDLRELGAPLLEELEITSSSHVSGITTILDCGAPSLRHLRLIGMSLQRFGPALNQLTKLDLTTNCPMQFTVFKGLCQKMVKLEELTLRSRVVEAWPLYPSKDEIIPLPALKVLKVSDRRWPLFIPLLSISAPALHTLSLYDLVAHDLPDTFMEPQLRDTTPRSAT
ncbi:hypothetical protein NLJ89_g10325 [Agrocybe chaxingu]|uniref:F-box domain-containing protein n=1 Tax=Agrocybe chaxingu TaxID=84603 RepID=A0A9W8JP26_9AGAR|nr:hypothetical protein NLJ89_g10325 [Agrocybe chaxingu]